MKMKTILVWLGLLVLVTRLAVSKPNPTGKGHERGDFGKVVTQPSLKGQCTHGVKHAIPPDAKLSCMRETP